MKTHSKKAGGLAAAILAIVATITAVEGGFVDNPRDPGGATNHGMTERVARSNGYTGDMRDLPKAFADKVYTDDYIIRPGFDAVIERSVAVGEEIADQGVNFGPHRPSCYFQRALNALNRQGRDYRDIKVDCDVGPATMAAYDALARKRGAVGACSLMIKLLDAQQASEYLRLAEANSRLETFMPGWIAARVGNVGPARCGK